MSTKTTILSIDDNLQNLTLIEKALCKVFNVVSSDGNEPILELVERVKPSIILLDIMLEGKTGYDLCQELYESTDNTNIVVIFVSALSSLEDKLKAYSCGGLDYICKPVDLVELIEKLKVIDKNIQHSQQLSQQAQFASTTAFTSMKQASELGYLIQFFTETCEVLSNDELFEKITDFFKLFDVTCSLVFRTSVGQEQYPKDIQSRLESEILNLSRGANRIISLNNKMLVNSPYCSLLIKGLPVEDEELMGRLRDHFAVLLTIIESRLLFIDSEQKRQSDRQLHITKLIDGVSDTFLFIKEQVLQQETEVYQLNLSLSNKMNTKMFSLGLNEDQEDEINSFIEEAKEELSDIMTASCDIDLALNKVNRLLQNLNE